MKKKINSLLDYGSRILEVDLHYFAKGSFWLTANQAVSAIIGFLLSLVYARFLPKVVYGQYVYVFSFIYFFGNFAYPGMSTAVIRAVAQGREQIIKGASKKTLPWALISAIPFLGLAGFYLSKTPPDLKLFKTFLVCFFLTIPYWSFRFFNDYFIGARKFKQFFTISTISQIIRFAFIGIAVLSFSSIFYLVVIALAANTVLHFIFSQWTRRQLKPSGLMEKDFAYAKGLNDIRIFANLTQFLDKVIVAKLLGFEAVAVYSFAQIIPEQIKVLLKNFSILALPKLSQSNIIKKKKKFYQKLLQFTFFTSFLILVYLLLAPLIFRFAFPKYIEAVLPSQILAISLITTPSLIISAFFESQADTRSLRLKIYPTSLIHLLLMTFLTLRFGLIGTIAALVLSRFFSAVLNILLLLTKTS